MMTESKQLYVNKIQFTILSLKKNRRMSVTRYSFSNCTDVKDLRKIDNFLTSET